MPRVLRWFVGLGCIGAVLALWVIAGDDDGWTWHRIAHRYTFRELDRLVVATLVLGGGAVVAFSRHPRESAAGVILGLVSLSLFWGVLELPAALGWVDYRNWLGASHPFGFTRPRPWDNPANEPDPDLLFRRRPHQEFSGLTTGDIVSAYGISTDRRYAVELRYDHHGFRNPEDQQQADIAVVGDSFVEAGIVPLAETLTARLARLTGRTVANLGVSGYGPFRERIVVDRYALPLGSRDVVWLFFEGNDILDTSRYERQRAELAEKRVPPSDFSDRSLTRNLFGKLAILTSGPPRQDSPRAIQRRCYLGAVPLYFNYVARELDERERGWLTRAKAEIASAAASVHNAGGRFLLAFAPMKYRVYADLCEPEPDSDLATWTLSELDTELAAFARQEGIEFVDLTGPLVVAAESGELVYFPDDTHWNAAGHRVAADVLFSRLDGSSERTHD